MIRSCQKEEKIKSQSSPKYCGQIWSFIKVTAEETKIFLLNFLAECSFPTDLALFRYRSSPNGLVLTHASSSSGALFFFKPCTTQQSCLFSQLAK